MFDTKETFDKLLKTATKILILCSQNNLVNGDFVNDESNSSQIKSKTYSKDAWEAFIIIYLLIYYLIIK